MDAGTVVRPIMGAVDNVALANPFALTPRALDDIGTAATRVDEAIGRIEQIVAQHGDGPFDDALMAATKDARLGVRNVNLEAQARIEPYISAEGLVDDAVYSRLKNADATLEDLNWQLAKNPSPDGRFSGMDLPGALRDGRAAVSILRELAPAPGQLA